MLLWLKPVGRLRKLQPNLECMDYKFWIVESHLCVSVKTVPIITLILNRFERCPTLGKLLKNELSMQQNRVIFKGEDAKCMHYFCDANRMKI